MFSDDALSFHVAATGRRSLDLGGLANVGGKLGGDDAPFYHPCPWAA